LRRRTARLEAEAKAQQEADEQVRSLHLVIGKLDLFATMVHDRLAGADWATKRDIICTLVKHIEVADDVVRVIFRVDPGFSSPPEARRTLHHCHARRHQWTRQEQVDQLRQPGVGAGPGRNSVHQLAGGDETVEVLIGNGQRLFQHLAEALQLLQSPFCASLARAACWARIRGQSGSTSPAPGGSSFTRSLLREPVDGQCRHPTSEAWASSLGSQTPQLVIPIY
jgi:hypothetical protein